MTRTVRSPPVGLPPTLHPWLTVALSAALDVGGRRQLRGALPQPIGVPCSALRLSWFSCIARQPFTVSNPPRRRRVRRHARALVDREFPLGSQVLELHSPLFALSCSWLCYPSSGVAEEEKRSVTGWRWLPRKWPINRFLGGGNEGWRPGGRGAFPIPIDMYNGRSGSRFWMGAASILTLMLRIVGGWRCSRHSPTLF